MATHNVALNESRKPDILPSGDGKKSTARILAITSGKGGVGKTNISTNLGIALVSMGKKVCIFDADMGLANINILIGKSPDNTLEDILSDDKDINQVLMDGPGGIKIVPASSGLEKIVELDPQRKDKLISVFEEIEREFDYILIDTSAGISSTVLSFVQSAQEAVVVVSPEPTSLTDSYALIKVLKARGFGGNIYILVNMVLSYEDSVKIFNRFNAATKKYLSLETKYLGHVMMDQNLIASVIQQKPIMVLSPESISSRCFASIARKFESIYIKNKASTFSEYWKVDASNKEKPDNKVIVTPPKDIREKFSQPQSFSLGDHIDKVSQIIRSGACSEDMAKEAIQKLENSFTKKFDKLPYDIKTALYSSLEYSDFSDGNIKELSQFIESLYEKRFKRPLHNIRDTFIKLLEESKISEEKMKIILQLVENFFRKRFNKSIYNLKEVLTGELGRDDFFESDFTETIEKIKEIYFERFGVPFEEPGFFPEAEIEGIFNEMREQERKFGDLMDRASNLSKKREESSIQLKRLLDEFSQGKIKS